MSWLLEIENVAGIYHAQTTIREGVNAVHASNWQGKSSLITAIEAVMGIERPLTEGESRGRVVLEGNDERYEVELVRNGDGVHLRGDPYLTDEYDRVCAELYTFLGEENPVREAVIDGENLESVLTKPLDFENIDERIRELTREREQVEAELERSEQAANRSVTLQSRVSGLESELDELREERESLAAESDVTGDHDELSELRAEREQVTDLINRLENTVDRTSEKLTERYVELKELTVPENEDIESELADAREELVKAERDLELIESVYTANKRLLEEGRVELVTDVDHGVIDDEHTCWACGAETEQGAVEEQLEVLGEHVAEIRDTITDHRERIDELEEHREQVTRANRRKQDLEKEIANLESTLADREEALESAQDRLAAIEERISTYEESVTEVNERLTDLGSEIKYTEAKLEDAREELAACEQDADQRDLLKDERDRLVEEIQRLRDRKDEMRRRTREAFDDAMADILDRFETGFEAARLTSDFDLVVARNGRESSWNALSEGEREILGFVAALAGYMAFDVAEKTPFLLLDRLGGIADTNLHALVDYMQEHSEYLVLTVYPENSSFDGWEIDPTGWSVVSADSEVNAAPNASG